MFATLIMANAVVLEVCFMFLPYNSKHCQFLSKKNHKKIFKKILHNFNLKIYFRDKIKSLQKNVFTKEQFKEITKEQLKKCLIQIFKQIFIVASEIHEPHAEKPAKKIEEKSMSALCKDFHTCKCRVFLFSLSKCL